MDTRLRLLLVSLVLGAAARSVLALEHADGRGLLPENGISRTLKHIYAHCADKDDIFWCFKVQGAKLLGRALKVQHIRILDGVTLVKKVDNETRTGRASAPASHLNNRDIEKLSLKSLDALLVERFANFVHSRQLQVNLPRLLMFGQRNSQDLLQTVLGFFTQFNDDSPDNDDASDEGRKKKDDKKYLGPFIAAVMLKTAILKMAYHSIAIVAGKALIVGKIALIISAIIGLKKLVSSEGGEKTTYEIVKHPQVQHSQTYSSSHSGEYEGGHESGGSYHRSMDDEMMMQDKAYQAWVPTKVA